ncbi:MAG: DUF4906 domain-containing protein [Bacteroidales bacterium]|nr:DUF4906 domain-containing protein [Bacteroidales bacterium]
MKKTRISVLAALSALSVTLWSCASGITGDMEPVQDTHAVAKMNLRITGNGSTRSSISPDEGLIENICVMAYGQKDGMLADMQTGSSADEIEMELTSGTYNIYVTANMGTFNAPVKESEIKDAFHTITSFSELGKSIPMSWKGMAELKSGEKTTVYAELSRLVSKVGFNVEMGVLDGLDITSARLCQAAGRIRPFMDGGSRIISPAEAADGDYASAEDIESLMKGESIFFYVAENCQGTLLPDNDDPWAKVPDNIGEMADLCTYVEMTGQWNEGADYEGSVTYRFYLGEDASKSFDIRGNCIHNLTLYLEEESFDKISWKIDASKMESVAWEAYSSLNDNFHEQDDFYVTEKICLDFSFDERGQKYWKKRNYAFTLAGIDYDGNTIIRFDPATNLGKGKFQAIGTCVGAGSYDIVLLDAVTGSIRYVLEHGTIHIPNAVAGEDDVFADTPVEGFKYYSRFDINGEYSDICIYLTDRDGYNLNQGHYYGCDFSICRWDTEILNTIYGHDLFDNAYVETIPGDTGSDGYAVCYRISFDNDGKNSKWNKELTESLGGDILRFRFTDPVSGASGEHPMALYSQSMQITFKPTPDAARSALGTEFMYAVDNPSNLPLSIRGVKLNSMSQKPEQTKASTILCKDIPGHNGTDPLLISKMPSVICSLEEGAAPSVIIDGKRCFPAYDDGIEQSDIPYQLAMFHTFEVKYAHAEDILISNLSGKLDLYDTSAHLALYGKNKYLNCGAIMHTSSSSLSLFDANNGLETDFSDYGSILEKNYIDKFNEIIEIDLSINENNEIIATASADATIDLTVSGNIAGHIRCISIQDPFSTLMGHYFTHSQEFSSVSTVKVGPTPTVADETTINNAFAGMRQQKYYSVLDAASIDEFRNPKTMVGTVREYLKPQSISLVIKVSTPTDIPVAVRFSGNVRYDYKTTDPVSWPTGLGYVTMVPSTYAGFDSRVDDDGCPPASVFKEELLVLEPKVVFNRNQGLFFIPQP